MSDDMGDKFKQIADMLGQNSNANIPDNVKGLLNMLMSNNSTKDESPPDNTPQKQSTTEESPRADADEVNDVARKMKKAVNMLSAPNDPKVNLLNAINPYLNKNRQRKLQTCMKLLKMGSLTKLFDDSD